MQSILSRSIVLLLAQFQFNSVLSINHEDASFVQVGGEKSKNAGRKKAKKPPKEKSIVLQLMRNACGKMPADLQPFCEQNEILDKIAEDFLKENPHAACADESCKKGMISLFLNANLLKAQQLVEAGLKGRTAVNDTDSKQKKSSADQRETTSEEIFNDIAQRFWENVLSKKVPPCSEDDCKLAARAFLDKYPDAYVSDDKNAIHGVSHETAVRFLNRYFASKKPMAPPPPPPNAAPPPPPFALPTGLLNSKPDSQEMKEAADLYFQFEIKPLFDEAKAEAVVLRNEFEKIDASALVLRTTAGPKNLLKKPYQYWTMFRRAENKFDNLVSVEKEKLQKIFDSGSQPEESHLKRIQNDLFNVLLPVRGAKVGCEYIAEKSRSKVESKKAKPGKQNNKSKAPKLDDISSIFKDARVTIEELSREVFEKVGTLKQNGAYIRNAHQDMFLRLHQQWESYHADVRDHDFDLNIVKANLARLLLSAHAAKSVVLIIEFTQTQKKPRDTKSGSQMSKVCSKLCEVLTYFAMSGLTSPDLQSCEAAASSIDTLKSGDKLVDPKREDLDGEQIEIDPLQIFHDFFPHPVDPMMFYTHLSTIIQETPKKMHKMHKKDGITKSLRLAFFFEIVLETIQFTKEKLQQISEPAEDSQSKDAGNVDRIPELLKQKEEGKKEKRTIPRLSFASIDLAEATTKMLKFREKFLNRVAPFPELAEEPRFCTAEKDVFDVAETELKKLSHDVEKEEMSDDKCRDRIKEILQPVQEFLTKVEGARAEKVQQIVAAQKREKQASQKRAQSLQDAFDPILSEKIKNELESNFDSWRQHSDKAAAKLYQLQKNEKICSDIDDLTDDDNDYLLDWLEEGLLYLDEKISNYAIELAPTAFGNHKEVLRYATSKCTKLRADKPEDKTLLKQKVLDIINPCEILYDKMRYMKLKIWMEVMTKVREDLPDRPKSYYTEQKVEAAAHAFLEKYPNAETPTSKNSNQSDRFDDQDVKKFLLHLYLSELSEHDFSELHDSVIAEMQSFASESDSRITEDQREFCNYYHYKWFAKDFLWDHPASVFGDECQHKPLVRMYMKNSLKRLSAEKATTGETNTAEERAVLDPEANKCDELTPVEKYELQQKKEQELEQKRKQEKAEQRRLKKLEQKAVKFWHGNQKSKFVNRLKTFSLQNKKSNTDQQKAQEQFEHKAKRSVVQKLHNKQKISQNLEKRLQGSNEKSLKQSFESWRTEAQSAVEQQRLEEAARNQFHPETSPLSEWLPSAQGGELDAFASAFEPAAAPTDQEIFVDNLLKSDEENLNFIPPQQEEFSLFSENQSAVSPISPIQKPTHKVQTDLDRQLLNMEELQELQFEQEKRHLERITELEQKIADKELKMEELQNIQFDQEKRHLERLQELEQKVADKKRQVAETEEQNQKITLLLEQQERNLVPLLEEQKQLIADKDKQITDQDQKLANNVRRLAEQKQLIADNDKKIADQDQKLANNERRLAEMEQMESIPQNQSGSDPQFHLDMNMLPPSSPVLNFARPVSAESGYSFTSSGRSSPMPIVDKTNRKVTEMFSKVPEQLVSVAVEHFPLYIEIVQDENKLKTFKMTAKYPPTADYLPVWKALEVA